MNIYTNLPQEMNIVGKEINVPLNNEDYPHHPAIAFCKEGMTVLTEGKYEEVNIDMQFFPTPDPHRMLQMYLITNGDGHLKEILLQTVKCGEIKE